MHRIIPVPVLSLILLLTIPILPACDDDSTSPGEDGGGSTLTGEYVVFAWNDLGMHCLNDTYNQAVILPPYNNVWAQVIERGDPPKVVTAGLTVEFAIENNTFSYGKREYGGFWDNADEIFRFNPGFTAPPHDIGLTGTGLSGHMEAASDHFVAEGIPLVPVNDSAEYSAYQIALITVKDGEGTVLASTRATAPVSDEMNCAKCHGADAWADAIADHDRLHMTSLADSVPFLCASCHGSPALGTVGPGSAGLYLSEAVHGAHAGREASCYDCHPGVNTKCMRSEKHTTADGNCEACHGDMAEVASSITDGRVPWADEPSCGSCHTGVPGLEPSGTLFRNATGHGSVNCAACHHSPHAMYPSTLEADNYQPIEYQGGAKTIGSCGVCHDDSRGDVDDIHEFDEKHGTADPDRIINCHVCHTVVRDNTNNWPHQWKWNNSND
jgi:hypothetical protein